jgi:hypothetical protein
MPGVYECSLLKETHNSPPLYRTNFSEGSGNVAKGGRIPAGIWGLIQKLVTNDSYSGFYNRVAANVQDSNKLVVRRKLWHPKAQES